MQQEQSVPDARHDIHRVPERWTCVEDTLSLQGLSKKCPVHREMGERRWSDDVASLQSTLQLLIAQHNFFCKYLKFCIQYLQLIDEIVASFHFGCVLLTLQ
jgi:hypothetical protein